MMMNNKKIVKAGLLMFVAGCILALGTAAIEKRDVFSIISNGVTIEKDGVFDADKINAIDIDTDVGKVVIDESNDDKIHYYFKGDERLKFEIKEYDNKLNILVSQRSVFWFGFTKMGGDINIQLPKKQFNQLKINADVGSVKVEDAMFKDVDIDSNVGKIDLQYLKVSNDLKLNADVGAVYLKEISSVDKLDISSNVGSVSIDKLDAKEASIKSDVGSIDISEMYANRVTIKSDVGAITFINENTDFDFEKVDIDSSVGRKTVKID